MAWFCLSAFPRQSSFGIFFFRWPIKCPCLWQWGSLKITEYCKVEFFITMYHGLKLIFIFLVMSISTKIMSYISMVLKVLQSAFVCIISFYPPKKIVIEVEFACMSFFALNLNSLKLYVFKYFAKGDKSSKLYIWGWFWGLSAVPFLALLDFKN